MLDSGKLTPDLLGSLILFVFCALSQSILCMKLSSFIFMKNDFSFSDANSQNM